MITAELVSGKYKATRMMLADMAGAVVSYGGRHVLAATVVHGEPVNIEVEPWAQHISAHRVKGRALDMLVAVARLA